MTSTTPLVMCGNVGRRESFIDAIAAAGWPSVVSASGLSEGAKVLRMMNSACVIVDAELNDMSGLTAAQILRDLCPHVKIIFTSPRNTIQLESQVRALDVFYYHVHTSEDTAELVAAVEDAIGEPRAGRSCQELKVLVVDDDADFQKAMQAILESSGFRVVSAYSEKEGLELARRERPNAIILDIIMDSTTDGFEFCRQARRDPGIKHTPILGLSAIEDKIPLGSPPNADGDLFPVDMYLRKPVMPQRLIAVLRRLITRET